MPLPLLGAGVIAVGIRAIFLGLIGSLIANAPKIITRILAGLGLYFLVAKPVGSLLRDRVASAFGAVGGTALETLYYLNVDDYVIAVVTAYALSTSYRAGLKVAKRPS